MKKTIEELETAAMNADEDCPCCRWMKEEMGVIEAAPFEMLIEQGIELPEPETVPEEQIHQLLWRTIEGLASLNVFLESADHLSDRELYEKLWNETLREELWLSPDDDRSACHVDFSGSNGEDFNRYLRYYADEESRESWKRDYPEDEVPPHEEPPYRRDRMPVPRQFNWKSVPF